jgi:hypothetical protein
VEYVTVYAKFSIKSKSYSIATVLSCTSIIRSALKEEVKRRIIKRVEKEAKELSVKVSHISDEEVARLIREDGER